MSVLDKLASARGRRDEVPNQELARSLATGKDRAGIREIVANLASPDAAVQADCIKVLYEIGHIQPALISAYAEDFLALLHSRNNRMVWGGMIALAAIAGLKAEFIFTHRAEIQKAMASGSVITSDNSVLALSRAAAAGEKYRKALFPILLNHLKTCRPKDLAQHSEKILPAVDASNRSQLVTVLTRRMADVSGSAVSRVKKVVKQAEEI